MSVSYLLTGRVRILVRWEPVSRPGRHSGGPSFHQAFHLDSYLCTAFPQMWRIVQQALMLTVVGARDTAFGDPPFPLTISSQYRRHLRNRSIMASPHEWKKVLITAIITHRIRDKLLCYPDGIPLNATRSFSTALYSVGHSPYHIINSW